MKSHVMRVAFAARVRSLAVKQGPTSLPGRLRPEWLSTAAEMYAPTASNGVHDTEVLAMLSVMHGKHPERFYSHEEAAGMLQAMKSNKPI